jgi:hypothetical protein
MRRFVWLALFCVVLPACRDTRRRGGGDDAGPIFAFDAGPIFPFDAGMIEPFDAGMTGSDLDAPLRIVPTGAMGRLEIMHEGQWGTICDDSFDELDANVACRQLGFSTGSFFTEGAGADPIWLDDLGCTGSETTLARCAHPGWGVHNCSHSEDVGVTCVP